jgi:hypothetical protein
MSGRNYVVVVAALVAAVLAMSSARAQHPVVAADGCAILAMLVHTEVTEARFRNSLPSGDPVYPGPGETTICGQTTRTVTAAFTSSLRTMNTYVSWGTIRGSSGDYCQSHFLSQCYPDRDPHMPPPSAAERKFVADSWSAISGAVSSTMATAPGADISRFDQARLKFSIKSRLATHRAAGEAADTSFSH